MAGRQLCSLSNTMATPTEDCSCLTVQGKTFTIRGLIAKGGFWELYRAVCESTLEGIAIKITDAKDPLSVKENEILRALVGVDGVPSWICYNSDGVNRMIMMELLGPSLHELLQLKGGKFSLKTTLMLGLQVIARLEGIHYRNIVHRDIKPSNILMGLDGRNARNTYIVDFGLGKFFRHSKTLEHIPKRVEKGALIGTLGYASIKAHFGEELSRRDDLESLCYTLIFLVKGTLPWHNKNKYEKKTEQQERVKRIKMGIPVAELCKDLPLVFSKLLIYSRNLAFEAAPDYSYMKQLLESAMTELGYSYDYKYDWVAETY